MESGGGMVDGEYGHGIRQCHWFSMDGRHTERWEKMTEGMATKRTNDAWPNDSNLHFEPWHALLFFLRCRVPVAGGAIFHDVRDVHVLSLKADGMKEFIEELPCGSDEWASEFVLFLSGRFPDEHDLRCGVSLAKDRFRRLVELASFP